MKLIKRDPNLAYLDNTLWIPKSQINVEGVKHALEFELPERNMIKVLQLWEEAEHHLIVPRAFWKPEDLSFPCIDCRPEYFPRADIRSNICLDMKPGPGGLLQQTGSDLQKRAIEALLKATGGTLQLACGKGKTVVALHLASLLKVPVIIAVDNTHLLRQWQEEIAKHLVVPGGVGLIQGQVKDWKKDIVMATYQTLARWADTMPEHIRRRFGLVIWDEGHHVNAPTFSKSAPLFYGYRLALTATPDRLDGSHVICQHHVGDIIFKDVIQDCPPSITFKWTGYRLDLESDEVKKEVCDKNSEIHLGKIASHFGGNRDRLVNIVLPEVARLVAMKHKVLVLSYSVDEVINLMTLWTRQDPNTLLYSEIPYPTPNEVGETLTPVELKPVAAKRLEDTAAEIRRNLNRQNLPAAKRTAFTERLKNYTTLLKQFEVWKKTEKVYRQRQRQFIQALLTAPSDSGLFTEAVKPEDRFQMLRERQVIFAIMKYGKEGLDDKKLSAIVVSEPMSDRNTLQQIMGRPRNKSNSELVFLEDDIAPLIGQCRKLRRHLREWPVEEGGPFRYNLVGHPATLRRQGATTWNQLSQQTTDRWDPQSKRQPGLRSPVAPTGTLHSR
jgi:hypothetical protein